MHNDGPWWFGESGGYISRITAAQDVWFNQLKLLPPDLVVMASNLWDVGRHVLEYKNNTQASGADGVLPLELPEEFLTAWRRNATNAIKLARRAFQRVSAGCYLKRRKNNPPPGRG